jgi:hypothetical protein
LSFGLLQQAARIESGNSTNSGTRYAPIVCA